MLTTTYYYCTVCPVVSYRSGRKCKEHFRIDINMNMSLYLRREWQRVKRYQVYNREKRLGYLVYIMSRPAAVRPNCRFCDGLFFFAPFAHRRALTPGSTRRTRTSTCCAWRRGTVRGMRFSRRSSECSASTPRWRSCFPFRMPTRRSVSLALSIVSPTRTYCSVLCLVS